MRRLALVLVAALTTVSACKLTKLKPNFCHTDKDCKTGFRCAVDASWECVDPDASMPDARDGGDKGDGGDAGDVRDAPPPFSCSQCADAGPDGSARVCVEDAAMCVECVEDNDCVSKSIMTPKCESRMCRPCRTDNECPSPNICLTDGRCATDEVIFVEFRSSGCGSADGSPANPFCAPNDAVAKLASDKNVIVIRGPAADRMTLNTTGVAPVVIGKPGTGSAAASIPATAATAIQVLSDTVLIRDIAVIGGTAATSKGIVVSGSMTSATLLNVQVKLTTGLAIQADTGAQLTMDRCTVTDNSVGGVLINGAGYNIENSVLAANGYGIQFSAPKSSSRFRFNTVVGTVAAFCELSNSQTLSDSIIVGVSTNCELMECVTTMPAFSSTRPYRLMSKLPCPNADASSFPNHDIDNDPRTPPIDCGADQFVQ